MLNIGPQELLLILVIALVVVGPGRLPELARSIGKGLREIRRAQDEVRKTVEVSLGPDEPRGSGPRPPFDEPRASDADPPPAGEGEAGAVADVSRTLGRGLAELRRAREEVQRSFRVDLTESASPPSRDAEGSPPEEPAGSDADPGERPPA
jgi:sec-independent protein translocase protein TatA